MFLDQQDLAWIYKLYRLGRTTAECSDAAGMWQQLLENIVGIFKAGSGCLAEVQDKGGLKIQAGIGLPEGVVGSELAAGSGILGLVATEGKPRLLNGNLSNNQALADRLPQRTRPAPWSAMCWPLIVKDRVLGVISVNRVQEEAPFSEKDLERGAQLIELIAVAVENAQLNLKSANYVTELKEMNRKQALSRVSREWLVEAQAELEKSGDLKQFCTQAAAQLKILLSAAWGVLLVEEKTKSDFSIFSSHENVGLEKDLRNRFKDGLPNTLFCLTNDDAPGSHFFNAIGAPLTMPGGLKGFFMAGKSAPSSPFDANDDESLATFSASVQRILEQHQLLHALYRANHALKAERDELHAAIAQLKASRD